MHLAINAAFWNRPDTGSGQYTRQLVAHLAQLAPEARLSLIAPGYLEPPLSLPGSCTWHPTPARPGNLGKVLFEQIGFPRACQQLQADLAHVPYWGSPLKSPVRTIVTVHDLIPLLLREYRGGPLARLYTSLVAAAARGADHVITDSLASQADILTHLGIPEDRITAIHLAADECFRPAPEGWRMNPAIATRYGLPAAYALYLGSLDVRKNVRALLHAYTYVAQALGADLPLVLAGRLPEKPSTRFPDLGRLIDHLEIGAYVRLIGLVDEEDKSALYRAATALIQPSLYEGFGLTPLEAMACGTPVIVSECSSLPEVVGAAGFTFDPFDVKGLAGAIIACATQPELHADLRQRGLTQAARFSWQRTAAQTIEVYHQVLG